MSRLEPFSLPLDPPLSTAAGAIDRRDGFLVRLGDEPVGLGEATPLPGWTEPVDACRDALDSALAADRFPETLDDLPDLEETPAARHGLELAVLDRAATAAGVPLYEYLGGRRRVSTVPVNATVGDGDVGATVEACRGAVAAGFRTIKVKVGARPLDADLERLAETRATVGDAVELRVDANGAWAPDEADAALEGFAAAEVGVVEQPLEPAALDAHAELRGRGVDIALDESLRDHSLEAVLAAAAADVVVVKPMVQGGVSRGAALAGRAVDAGLDVIVTTTVDGAVARAGAIHLAAALDGDRACGLATAGRLVRDVAADAAPVVDGGVSVPQRAGHGVRVEDLG